MTRSLKTRRPLTALGAALPLLALSAAGAALPRAARAAAYSYGSQARTVNAGVVVLGQANTPTAYVPDPAPYLFYTLNLRPDVKPFGWNVVNPHAPSVVSQAISSRWQATATPAPYSVGQAVTPSQAAYWEVPLRDTSADQLRQYDVLYLPMTLGSVVTPGDNEKLRRFVDNGGELLVEYVPAGGSGSLAQTISPNFFFGAMTATGPASATPGVGLDLPPTGVAAAPFVRHPLLMESYTFGRGDFGGLGLTGSQFSLSPSVADFWGTALVDTGGLTGTAVYASQIGAGVLVSSGLSVGPTLSPATAYYVPPQAGQSPDPQPLADSAPTSGLKLLANLISYGDTHPNENKTARQNGSAADLASFAPAWTAAVAPAASAPAAPGGAAVWGKFIFVTDVNGVLRAFDALPGEDLTGGGRADDGVVDLGDPTNPKSYDEVWEAGGPYGSAPTVFSDGGATYVMAEDSAGKVTYFNAVTGTLAGTVTPTGNGGATFAAGTPVPAPTYYGGRIYAGQASGNLFVLDLRSGNSASGGVAVPLNPAAAAGGGAGPGEPVTGSPAVGLIAEGAITNDIVALVPTTQNLYTVFLGARADALSANSTANAALGTPSTYSINRGRLQLFDMRADTASRVGPQQGTGGPQGFSLDFGAGGISLGAYSTPPAPPGNASGFAEFSSLSPGTYYANYDVDFGQSLSTSGDTLTLNAISALSYGDTIGGATPSSSNVTISAPAGGRTGDFFYTVNTGPNSYVIGLRPSPQARSAFLTFRFKLPRNNDGQANDPDGVNWSALNGFSFVGAPVVDAEGRVYVAAVNGAAGAVLCFDSTQDVYAAQPGLDFSQATITQPDEGTAAAGPNTILAGGILPANNGNVQPFTYGQYTASDGRATFFNFGRATSSPRQIAGNLSEPQPVSVAPGGATDPNVLGTTLTLPLHTNLAWYTTFNVSGPITGVSKVGDTVLLADSGGSSASNTLYKINARAQVGAGKILTGSSALPALASTPLDVPIGAVRAAPSATGSTLVLNGTRGVSAFTRQLTLIADNNRVLEVDADGQAVWAADATTGAGGVKVDFSHPAGLSAVAANDYLAADTGNNRCVRFDRAGRALWELTRFSDPNHLLPAGSPDTLSAPTSVQSLRRGLAVSYLVSDTGNSRILEVTDTYNPDGTFAAYHVLSAATHTLDQQGRRYRYTSASYFRPDSPTDATILALVTNTRIAPLLAGNTLSPVSGDAPGGSMVSLAYDPAAYAASAPANQNGITGFRAVFTSFTAQAVTQVTRNPTTGAVTGTSVGPATFQVRTPRFLSVYNPPSGTTPSLLYADANGAFDLSPSLNAPVGNLQFTTADYQALTLPNNAGAAVNRTNTPFVPTCVQRLDSGGANPRYLLTQSAGQSELGTPPALTTTGTPPVTTVGPVGFGGEVFEVNYNQVLPLASPPAYVRQIGTYGQGLLSRPLLTGPLVQPTAALRQ